MKENFRVSDIEEERKPAGKKSPQWHAFNRGKTQNLWGKGCKQDVKKRKIQA